MLKNQSHDRLSSVDGLIFRQHSTRASECAHGFE